MKRLAGYAMYALVVALRPVRRVRRLVIGARLWVLDKRVERIDRVRERLMRRMFRLLVKLGTIK